MNLGAFLKARWEHTRNARRSRDEIEALQRRKFRRLLAHVNEHSPYYRDLIASRDIDIATCAPTDFPPLTKPVLMENFDRIVTDPRISIAGIERFLLGSRDPRKRFLGEYVVIHTSGTSGTIGFFVRSQSEYSRGLALAMRTYPASLRRRRIAFFGIIGGHLFGATNISETRGSLAKLRFDSRPFDISDPFPEVVEGLNSFQPDILAGYPTVLRELANAQESGALHISPSLLSVGGEPISAEDRASFDRVFGADISNHYGTSEHSIMGYGLSGDSGIYLFEDELIFEIGDGHPFVTNLFNYTQPLIRYATDDLLEPVADPSPRLPFTKIKDIGDRPKPSPTFTNRHGDDDVIGWKKFTVFFAPDVERIELRVLDKLSCVLRIRLRHGVTEAERTEALARAKRQLDDVLAEQEMENVSRRIEEVSSFGGDKARLIVLPDIVDSSPTH
ncbi:MAG: phenylacetate--CoA ligase family protein [Alphaproteobacteria bacterium]